MSSYANFDHAAWMQQEIDRIKQNKPKLGKTLPDKLSDFQRRVCNILGIVGNGIYNAPINPERIIWNYGGGVSLNWHQELDSWDFNRLTVLVFLCHEARIRVQIESTGPRATRLSFWQRKAHGNSNITHPNLDEAVAMFREWFKPTHSINYKEENDAPGIESNQGISIVEAS